MQWDTVRLFHFNAIANILLKRLSCGTSSGDDSVFNTPPLHPRIKKCTCKFNLPSIYEIHVLLL
jgi:hypothetical protein